MVRNQIKSTDQTTKITSYSNVYYKKNIIIIEFILILTVFVFIVRLWMIVV